MKEHGGGKEGWVGDGGGVRNSERMGGYSCRRIGDVKLRDAYFFLTVMPLDHRGR